MILGAEITYYNNLYTLFVVLVAKLCLTLCNRMDYRPSGYSVHGISQAKIPEWVAIYFVRLSSETRDPTQISCIACGFWATREVCLYTEKELLIYMCEGSFSGHASEKGARSSDIRYQRGGAGRERRTGDWGSAGPGSPLLGSQRHQQQLLLHTCSPEDLVVNKAIRPLPTWCSGSYG